MNQEKKLSLDIDAEYKGDEPTLRKMRKEARESVGLPETATEEETDSALRSKQAKQLGIPETSSWQEISYEFTRQLGQKSQK